MFISFSTLFFRLLNTAALFTLLVYIFRKYFFETIKRAITQKELMQQSLIDREQQLRKSQEISEHSLTLQKQQAEDLFQKSAQWQQHVLAEQKRGQQEQMAAQQKLIALAAHRKNLLERSTIRKMIARPAVDQARKSLQTTFDNPQKGRAYLEELVHALAKRNA